MAEQVPWTPNMRSKPLIYLASPYSHPSFTVRKRRYIEVCHVASKLMNKGVMLFSPIAHTHSIAERGSLPKGFDYWREYDRLMLSKCDELWIATIDGWTESVGIRDEFQLAMEMGKPVKQVDPQYGYVSQEMHEFPAFYK